MKTDCSEWNGFLYTSYLCMYRWSKQIDNYLLKEVSISPFRKRIFHSVFICKAFSVWMFRLKGSCCLFAFRLISLSKNPGVRPIGVCKIICRVIGKAILSLVGGDIQSVTGAIQLCAGQQGGREAAVHAMHKIYDEGDADSILCLMLQNAFNSLNSSLT